ncbi:unnamed protein product [Spirodela intermedia]|uniref:Uncharacterized protein n=2 Tax=Spirodela intermedia TaxID=51605 RepID=A0A7I8KME2_SPIIN|nr:unnamed protein product [Spirodela intermedia]CAA6662556.1 unnamed protein product [Spirodela intermedia]CAA7398959.1 unnamed protein product [Spirodela intermedia]
MRPPVCRSCLGALLKFLNFLQAFIGVSIIVYSVWMLTKWSGHDSALLGGTLGDSNSLPEPWFIYLFMAIGVSVCAITSTGHIAAESINGCCLCFYAVLISALILFEASVVAILMLNTHWEEDLPRDRTGELDRLKKFIEVNIDVCRWVGVTVIIIQALSLFLALILRSLAPTTRRSDSDDDLPTVRAPLLYPHYGSAAPGAASPDGKVNSDIWSTRVREKYGLNQGVFPYAPSQGP